jgi:hypothetical protein
MVLAGVFIACVAINKIANMSNILADQQLVNSKELGEGLRKRIFKSGLIFYY